MKPDQKVADNVIIDKYNYLNLFTDSTNTGEEDYFSKNAARSAPSILDGKIITNGKSLRCQRKFYPNMGKYWINTDKKTTVDLPIIVYHGTTVKINVCLYPYKTSQRGTVKITLRKNIVNIGYKASSLYYGMLIVVGITIIVLLGKGIWLVLKNKIA